MKCEEGEEQYVADGKRGINISCYSLGQSPVGPPLALKDWSLAVMSCPDDRSMKSKEALV